MSLLGPQARKSDWKAAERLAKSIEDRYAMGIGTRAITLLRVRQWHLKNLYPAIDAIEVARAMGLDDARVVCAAALIAQERGDAMVCDNCSHANHEQCSSLFRSDGEPRSTVDAGAKSWCDCQHKKRREPVAEEAKVEVREENDREGQPAV